MHRVDKKQLLAEVEELIRSAPTSDSQALDRPEWLGQVSAVLTESLQNSSAVDSYLMDMKYRSVTGDIGSSYGRILVSLHRAKRILQWHTGVPTGVVIEEGMVFDYFDRIRTIIECAKHEIFFVDPYMEVDFVSRYMKFISSGVNSQLLTSKKSDTLVAALGMFAKQSRTNIEVRLSKHIHDRFIFVDQQSCYLSGASFKDGAKRSPTIIAQITDGFDVLFGCYRKIWSASKKLSLPD